LFVVLVAPESFKLFELGCQHQIVKLVVVDPISRWVGYLWLPTLESWLPLGAIRFLENFN
jgi:hypothetical protein